ncbi:Vms1/Ankzf1 family peptidyl-tRNA hydrolase [Streptomyces sp. NPDC006422]|uniref:baeRF2 domain-containing protein n=1 Tax=unclassified Streptomyces TaxID=2593676 RepID=UPI00339EB360
MDLAFLTPLCNRPGPWASVYVDTSRHTESTAEERSLEALGVQRALAAAGADEATAQAMRAAVEDLKHSSEPVGRAFFGRDGEVVLDPALSTPPGQTSAHWAALPHTTPLLDLAGEDPLCLVAYIDRTGADFELRSARGESTAGKVTGQQWPVHRTGSADWSERHFQLRVENTWEHNAGEIAEALARCQAETRAELVVLVGDDRECVAVRDRLPHQLKDSAVRARHGAESRLLDSELEQARAEQVAMRAAHDLALFAEARGQGEAAAEGVPALVDAAREHRVAELLIRSDGPDAHREVWVGDSPDQLGVRRTDAEALGGGDVVSARADDALMRCAAASGAAGLSVAGADPSAAPAGGLGALLRWSE